MFLFPMLPPPSVLETNDKTGRQRTRCLELLHPRSEADDQAGSRTGGKQRIQDPRLCEHCGLQTVPLAVTLQRIKVGRARPNAGIRDGDR